MKKNISINISGIIFHIEEDGYEKLKTYLESINRYFSNFEDSLEIIADIESRIAEIFLSKLKDGKQVVTLDDVEALMATMGSIKDFQAAEEESSYIPIPEEPGEKEASAEEKTDEREHMFSRKLYRDKKRKLLGGVLAGVAHYFSIDPLWVRLLYVLLFFGISILPSLAGFLFVAYIVMWIVIPESDELTDSRKIKKMYRNPDDKILGGVAGGVGAYFGVDVVVIRLLFVAGIFVAGIGLILYIILWIILPEAKTITDKMEMKGQPVTLSNIERNIKKSLKVEGKEENILVKILLFPFRLVAAVIDFLSGAFGPVLSFLAEAARIILGVILLLIGVLGIVTVIIGLGILIGLISQGGLQGDFYLIEGIPFELIRRELDILPTLGMALLIIIPMLILALSGIAIITKKMVVKARLGWLLLATWSIAFVLVALTVMPVIKSFRTKATVTIEEEYDPAGQTLIFSLNDPDDRLHMDEVSLSLRASESDRLKIEERYEAAGTNPEEARKNARMVSYELKVQDSVLAFDPYLTFNEGSRYRLQRLHLVAYVPEGRPFVIEPEMQNLLGSSLYKLGYSAEDIHDNTWRFDSLGLHCITCPPKTEKEPGTTDVSGSDSDPFGKIEGYQRTFDIEDFHSVEVNSPLEVLIRSGEAYNIILNGSKEVINDVVVDKTGDLLSIDFKSGALDWGKMRKDKAVKVFITAPEIQKLEFGGACRAQILDFEADVVELELSGAASVEANLQADEVYVDLKGASRLRLNGQGDYMEGELSGAAALDAFGFECTNAMLNTRTASTAKITVENKLTIEASGSSKIVYRGDPETDITSGNNAEVRPGD